MKIYDERRSHITNCDNISNFITSIIDVKEERQVAVIDQPGAFLHIDNNKHVIMFMRVRLAGLMMMVAPQTY